MEQRTKTGTVTTNVFNVYQHRSCQIAIPTYNLVALSALDGRAL